MFGLGNKQNRESKIAGRDLALVEADFTRFYDRANRYEALRARHQEKRAAGADVDPLGPFSSAIEETNTRQGIRWFNDHRENGSDKSWAQPLDYLKVRDDRQALVKFVNKILDIGSHWVGNDRDGSSQVINPIEYLLWLHKWSGHLPFKKNLEQVVVQLTHAELARNFVPVDLDAARKEATDQIKRTYPGASSELLEKIVGRDALSGALWRLDMAHNCPACDKPIRNKLINELQNTERPITLEEVFATYGGTKEYLRGLFEEGHFKETTAIHANEVPAAFKREFGEWYIEGAIKRVATQATSPQLNRLLGLLGVISGIGTPRNELAELAIPLRDRIESGYLENLEYTQNQVELDPFVCLAWALASLQKPNEMIPTWLNALSRASEPKRALALTQCGLSGCDGIDAKQDFIVRVLGILKTNLGQADLKHATLNAGFIHELNIGDILAADVARTLFGSNEVVPFFDQDSFSLGFVRPRIESKAAAFEWSHLTEHGRTQGELEFDPLNGSVVGPPEGQGLVQRYLDECGVPVTKNLAITSFEWRKIGEGSRLFSQFVSNDPYLIEGILGLNTVHVFYTFDPRTKNLKFALPKEDQGCYLFRTRNSTQDRSIGFENTKSMVSASELLAYEEFKALVVKRCKDGRKQGWLGASIYLLEHALGADEQARLGEFIIHKHSER